MEIDAALKTWSLTDLVRLQEELARTLLLRFGRSMAVAFTDIVGSTAYFARHGDQAGRRLQQRHFDLLDRAVQSAGGRVVDTAGDGAFTCFPSVDRACFAMTELMHLSSRDNDSAAEHALVLRAGIHFGSVLTDGVSVSGDTVNVASRVAGSAEPGQLKLSSAAFTELASRERPRCKPQGPTFLKGVPEPVDLYVLEWVDPASVPNEVLVVESNALITLPERDIIRFGRLKDHGGEPANDVVLELADPVRSKAVSRWHFELRRRPGEIRLRSVTERITEVNGVKVELGFEVPLRPGARVNLGNAVTLIFRNSALLASSPSGRFQVYSADEDEDATHVLPNDANARGRQS